MIKVVQLAQSGQQPRQAVVDINGTQFASMSPKDSTHEAIINSSISKDVGQAFVTSAHEINPANEALAQLRPFWDKIIVIMMRKMGIKELAIDAPDIEPIITKPPIICVLGRKKLGEDKGFTICLAESQTEMAGILAKHQGRG